MSDRSAAAVAHASRSDGDIRTRVRSAASGRGPICAHPDFAAELPKVKEQFERLGGLDVTEPFARIREAIGEARRMGVTQRAA